MLKMRLIELLLPFRLQQLRQHLPEWGQVVTLVIFLRTGDAAKLVPVLRALWLKAECSHDLSTVGLFASAAEHDNNKMRWYGDALKLLSLELAKSHHSVEGKGNFLLVKFMRKLALGSMFSSWQRLVLGAWFRGLSSPRPTLTAGQANHTLLFFLGRYRRFSSDESSVLSEDRPRDVWWQLYRHVSSF